MSGVKKGASAMLEVLATKVDGMESVLSEVRQDVKDIRDRVTRLETEMAALRSKPSNNNGWQKYVWNVISMLVGAVLTLAGVKITH